MHAFQVHPQKVPPPAVKPPRQRRWRRWGALTLLVLGVGGLVWAVRPDPHLARAKTLQKELFSAAGKSLSPEERKARYKADSEDVKNFYRVNSYPKK